MFTLKFYGWHDQIWKSKFYVYYAKYPQTYKKNKFTHLLFKENRDRAKLYENWSRMNGEEMRFLWKRKNAKGQKLQWSFIFSNKEDVLCDSNGFPLREHHVWNAPITAPPIGMHPWRGLKMIII